jgi:hypothetical protein
MSADAAFWIIPWKFLLTIFVVIGSFVTLFTWGIKLYVRKMLALAGVAPSTYRVDTEPSHIANLNQVKGTRGRPRKVSAVVAPIEIGILDLRTRLKGTASLKALFTTVITFIRAYWKFFIVVTAALIFIIGIIWFVRAALTPSRDFEVTILSEGQDVTISAKDFEKEKNNSSNNPESTAIKSLVPITIVNRSGKDSALQTAEDILKKAGFVVGDKSTDTGEPQAKTVIVYDPDNAELALEISALFDSALLSAFANNSSGDDEVVIYIGSDAENVD